MAVGFGFLPERRAFAVWDDQPGGKVLERWTDELGLTYVLVEFENSPGKHYVYFADEG